MRKVILIFIVVAFGSCVNNDRSSGNGKPNSLAEGVFEIVETDSGTVQTQAKIHLPKRMEQLNIPGLSATVINDFKIQESFVFGRRDSLNQVDEKTMFQAASVSKYVTAVIVHQFIDNGILDLDTDVNQYLKSWKMPENDFTKNNPVTLRYLLTHQSGLPSTNFDFNSEIGLPTLTQVLSAESPAVNKPAFPEFIPGTSWSYSNIGYALIQQILEDITNKPFETIAEEILFKPLKMEYSSFRYPLDSILSSKEAKPYNCDGVQMLPELNSPAKAQGGLLTTPTDLARLTVELMKAYKNQSEVFSKELAFRLVNKELELPFKFYNQDAYMGLGVLLIEDKQRLGFLHNGYNSPGSVCIAIGFPDVGKGAVIASNSANGEQLYLEVIATLAKMYNWPTGKFF